MARRAPRRKPGAVATPRPNIFGATLMTWETAHKGRGYLRAAGAIMRGSNVGHAALQLTIPNTEQNQKWVDQYCKSAGIPYFNKKVKVPEVRIDSNARSQPTGRTAFEADALVVYFSWWPKQEKDFAHPDQFTIVSPYQDTTGEHEGQKFTWDFETLNRLGLQDLTPSTYTWHGVFSDKEIHLGPKEILHARDQNSITALQQKKDEYEKAKELLVSKQEKLAHFMKYLVKLDQKLTKQKEKFFQNPENIHKLQRLRKNDIVAEIIHDPRQAGEDQLLDLQDLIQRLIETNQKKYRELQSQIDSQDYQYQALYASLGVPPDHQVTLPLRDTSAKGLNVKSMLQTMHTLATDGSGYFLGGKNCSQTVGRILESGAPPKAKKALKSHVGILGISTPQAVLDGAHEYAKFISGQIKPSLWDRFLAFLGLKELAKANNNNQKSTSEKTPFQPYIARRDVPKALRSHILYIDKKVSAKQTLNLMIQALSAEKVPVFHPHAQKQLIAYIKATNQQEVYGQLQQQAWSLLNTKINEYEREKASAPQLRTVLPLRSRFAQSARTIPEDTRTVVPVSPQRVIRRNSNTSQH